MTKYRKYAFFNSSIFSGLYYVKRIPRDSGMSHCKRRVLLHLMIAASEVVKGRYQMPFCLTFRRLFMKSSLARIPDQCVYYVIIMIYLHISSENLVQKRTLTSSWSFDNCRTRFMSRHYFTDYLFSRFIIPSYASHIKSSSWVSSSSLSPSLSSSSLSVLSPRKAQRDWLALVPASRFYAVT